MQNIEWNIARWNQIHDWPESGEEWSKSWGHSASQWNSTIFPRISNFLPATTVLEVAPGWGRWTRFLIPKSRNYFGFDTSPRAIAECNSRFCFDNSAEFFENNGKSLKQAEDGCVDFIFSMDSLVHAEIDAIEPYIKEFKRVLSHNGYGFIHHSNMGEHTTSNITNLHQRAKSISAEIFYELLIDNGLYCITQEKINWGQAETNDCFTLFTASPKFQNWHNKILENNKFDLEINHAKTLHDFYHFER